MLSFREEDLFSPKFEEKKLPTNFSHDPGLYINGHLFCELCLNPPNSFGDMKVDTQTDCHTDLPHFGPHY
jgi:hypothetical protein